MVSQQDVKDKIRRNKPKHWRQTGLKLDQKPCKNTYTKEVQNKLEFEDDDME